MTTPIIHSRLLASLMPGFYPSLCTIQQATETQDTYGQPILSWANVIGLVNLPCAIAQISTGSPERAERRRADGIIEEATHHIAIAGYYATIANKMRAIMGGVAWDIMGVEHDSHAVMTRLRVGRVQ